MLGHDAPNDGVPRLVIRGIEFLFIGHDHGFALGTHHDLVFGQLEFLHLDHTFTSTRSEQRSLVHQVGQVRTREPRSTASNHRRFNIITHRHLAHVHGQNLLATTDIGQAHHHLTVEATRAQQSRVQHVRTVGGGDHNDAVIHLEAVHLHQQLVEGLLALVVTTAHAGATVTTDRIDFVDEDDARRMLLGLFEHVAHAAGAHTYEHLDEIRTGDSEERHLGFTRDRLGQQGLTSTR